MKRQRRENRRLSRNPGLEAIPPSKMMVQFFSRSWNQLPRVKTGRRSDFSFVRLFPKRERKGGTRIGVYFEVVDTRGNMGWRFIYLPDKELPQTFWESTDWLLTDLGRQHWVQNPEAYIEKLFGKHEGTNIHRFDVCTLAYGKAEERYKKRHRRVLKAFMFYGSFLPGFYRPEDLQ